LLGFRTFFSSETFYYYAALPRRPHYALYPLVCLSVRPSVPCPPLNRKQQTTHTYIKGYPRQQELTEQFWDQKVKVQGHWRRKRGESHVASVIGTALK